MRWLLASVTLLCACSYDPPMQADHGAPAYQADLAACQASARTEAQLLVRQRVYLWASYPVSLPLEDRAQTRTCLQGKGYRLAR